MNKKILGINFADKKFRRAQKRNTWSMKYLGQIPEVVEYGPNDIESEFRERHARILSVKRGAGLWLWKPYFVLKALRMLKEGEFLFYCDSGAIVIRDVRHLVRDLEATGQDMMFFALPLLNRQFCKRETFAIMGIPEGEGMSNQAMATYFLLRKNARTESFISMWLEKCCDERLISPEHFCPEIPEFPDFVAHREDQSILSLLLFKASISLFKEPTQFGLFPWDYSVRNYLYREPEVLESCSPLILFSIRKTPILKSIVLISLKLILWKMGIYRAESAWKIKGRPIFLLDRSKKKLMMPYSRIGGGSPRVVVVTVCYNAQTEIERTLRSVVGQDYPNMEYIVVDGGSKDGTTDVIQKFDAQISRWVSEADCGIYDAMNKGVRLAEGDDGWVIFMNAGDTFCSSDVISRVFSRPVDDGVGLVYGNVVWPTPWGVLRKNCAPRVGEAEHLCHQCVFARMDLMKSIGFDLAYRVAADGRFFKAVKDLGMKFEHRPVFVANYDNFGGVSSQNRILVFKEYANMRGIRPFSPRWIALYLRYSARTLLACILPRRADMYLRYRSMKRSWRVSEEKAQYE